MKVLWIAAALTLAVGMSAIAKDSDRDAAATIVIYNRKDPASAALARYYADRRGIPETQLVGLSCSTDEEISRDDYLVDIAAPIRKSFSDQGWWKISRDPDGNRYVESARIRYAAIIRGVPMKIRPDPSRTASALPESSLPPSVLKTLWDHNEASVDSELSAMFTLTDEIAGVIPNGYYRRFAHILDIAPAHGPLLVCRLDGPSDAIVRRMIDDSLAAEKSGLWGWAYLDARNIKDPGLVEGDDWLTRAGAMMRKQGIPVISDYAPEIFPEGYPMTDAAIYYGWYTGSVAGPFIKPGFKFTRGAIAVHLHSFSATTIRDPKAAWAAPLLACGAAATMGNVYEPYLSLTVNFDLLQDRLMSGFNLAEAAYTALRGLSWMNVTLGDPLYRPYASWDSLGSDGGAPNIWQRYRDIILQAGGDPLAAEKALRQLAADAHSSMPLEALGQAQGAAEKFDAALKTLADASRIENSATIRFRLVLEQIELLRRAARPDDALQRISKALEIFKSNEQQVTLGNLVRAIRPPPAPPTPGT